MRAVIKERPAGRVTLTYDDIYLDRRRTREFMVPRKGGYVMECVGNDFKQVCDRLKSTGYTLRCGAKENLIDVIRREYRAMRAAEKAG